MLVENELIINEFYNRKNGESDFQIKNNKYLSSSDFLYQLPIEVYNISCSFTLIGDEPINLTNIYLNFTTNIQFAKQISLIKFTNFYKSLVIKFLNPKITVIIFPNGNVNSAGIGGLDQINPAVREIVLKLSNILSKSYYLKNLVITNILRKIKWTNCAINLIKVAQHFTNTDFLKTNGLIKGKRVYYNNLDIFPSLTIRDYLDDKSTISVNIFSSSCIVITNSLNENLIKYWLQSHIFPVISTYLINKICNKNFNK